MQTWLGSAWTPGMRMKDKQRRYYTDNHEHHHNHPQQQCYYRSHNYHQYHQCEHYQHEHHHQRNPYALHLHTIIIDAGCIALAPIPTAHLL